MTDHPDVDRKFVDSHVHHVTRKGRDDTCGGVLSRIVGQVYEGSTEILEGRSRSSWCTNDQRQVSTNWSIEDDAKQDSLEGTLKRKRNTEFLSNKESHEHDAEASVLKFGERFVYMIEIDEKHDRIRENLEFDNVTWRVVKSIPSSCLRWHD